MVRFTQTDDDNSGCQYCPGSAAEGLDVAVAMCIGPSAAWLTAVAALPVRSMNVM